MNTILLNKFNFRSFVALLSLGDAILCHLFLNSRCDSLLNFFHHCRIVLFERCLSGFVFSIMFPGKFTFEKWRTEHKQQQSTGHSIRAISTMKCCTIWRICVRFAIPCRIEKKYYIRSDKCFNSDSISWMQFFNLICMLPIREMVCMRFFSWLLFTDVQSNAISAIGYETI